MYGKATHDNAPHINVLINDKMVALMEAAWSRPYVSTFIHIKQPYG